jgi:hypothetical protein
VKRDMGRHRAHSAIQVLIVYHHGTQGLEIVSRACLFITQHTCPIGIPNEPAKHAQAGSTLQGGPSRIRQRLPHLPCSIVRLAS